MVHVRKTIAGMSGYTPGEQINQDVIKINTNENPYPTSPRVSEALQAIDIRDLQLYPNPVVQPLLDTAADIYRIPADHIIAGNGSDDLLTMVFRAMLDAGDTVSTFYPTYTLYEVLAKLQDASAAYTQLTENFQIPDDYNAGDSRFIIIANPNSPTGTLIPKTRIRELADTTDKLVVIDEAYGDFSSENCLSLVQECANIMVMRTFSKSYSLAGIRLGLGFANPAIISELMKVKDSYNVNRLTMAAGIAALEDQEWMLANRKKILATRDRFAVELAEMGLPSPPTESNFVFAKCPGTTAPQIYEALKAQNILIRYFAKERIDNYIRISIGTDEQMERVRDAISSILESFNKEGA